MIDWYVLHAPAISLIGKAVFHQVDALRFHSVFSNVNIGYPN